MVGGGRRLAALKLAGPCLAEEARSGASTSDARSLFGCKIRLITANLALCQCHLPLRWTLDWPQIDASSYAQRGVCRFSRYRSASPGRLEPKVTAGNRLSVASVPHPPYPYRRLAGRTPSLLQWASVSPHSFSKCLSFAVLINAADPWLPTQRGPSTRPAFIQPPSYSSRHLILYSHLLPPIKPFGSI